MTTNKRTSRYRAKGEAANYLCTECGTPIWVRRGTYTRYHGKGHYWNDSSKKEPCSYEFLLIQKEGSYKSGTACVDCYKKMPVHKLDPQRPK